MADLIIYGASDDLIEVVGVIDDELNPPYGKAATVAVRVDGEFVAAVVFEYGPDGGDEWRVLSTESATARSVRVFSARGGDAPADGDGCPTYSDKAVIELADVNASQVAVTIEKAA
jgi:hypothetical protein